MANPNQISSSAIHPFQTTFSVPIDCSSCVTTLHNALTAVPGMVSFSADKDRQLVHVTGTAAPSAIVTAIQSTGKDAILRGSGGGGAGAAAVCILETQISRSERDKEVDIPAGVDEASSVRGLARMVQVVPVSSPTGETDQAPRTLVDLTLRGVRAGRYHASIRQAGDISRGAASTGSIWDAVRKAAGLTSPSSSAGHSASTSSESIPREELLKGYIGTVDVEQGGAGSAFLDCEFGVSEVIGRGMVVSQAKVVSEGETFKGSEESTVVGVIARSAGVWENEKTVCSCSGKSVWEERKEQLSRGMV